MRSKGMRKEYDFSKGVRGKFSGKTLNLIFRSTLDADNLSFVTKIAERKKADISEIVNDLIRSDKRLDGVME